MSNKIAPVERNDRGDWHIHLSVLKIGHRLMMAPTFNGGCSFNPECGERFSLGLKDGKLTGDLARSIVDNNFLEYLGIKGYESYLGTPSGKIKIFDPAKGTVTDAGFVVKKMYGPYIAE